MSTSHTGHIAFEDRILGTTLIVALAFAVIHAKASVIAIFLLALVVIVWKVATQTDKRLTIPLNMPVILLTAFFLWALITCLWSPMPTNALKTLAGLAVTTLAGLIAIDTLRAQPSERARFLSVWALITYVTASFCVGLLLLYPNTVGMIFETLQLYTPGETTKLIRPNQSGELTVNRSYFNNSVAAVAAFLFPIILIIWTRFQGAAQLVLTVLTASIAYVTVFYSDHETSKLALIVAPIVFALGHLALKLTRGLVLIGWFAAVILSAPGSMIAHGHYALDTATWLPSSAQHRVAIWADTAHRSFDSPIVGHGVRASKYLNIVQAPAKIWAKGLSKSVARHPHNTFLQTFFETGIIGSLLFLGTGVILILSTATSVRTAPAVLATFTIATLLLAVCWDLWEAWQLAKYLLVMAVLALSFSAISTTAKSDTRASDA